MAILRVERFWLVVPKEEEAKLLELFKIFPGYTGKEQSTSRRSRADTALTSAG